MSKSGKDRSEVTVIDLIFVNLVCVFMFIAMLVEFFLSGSKFILFISFLIGVFSFFVAKISFFK